jgi:hypothetical protein
MRMPAPAMWVPIAAEHLNDLPEAWKHQIRAAGEVVNMQPITVAHRVYQPSYDHFWRTVFAPDVRHVSASSLC